MPTWNDQEQVLKLCDEQAAEIYNSDYKAFCTGFEKVRKAHFSNINPRTIERARSGDTDGAIDLLHEMGIVTKKGLED